MGELLIGDGAGEGESSFNRFAKALGASTAPRLGEEDEWREDSLGILMVEGG